MDALYYPGEMWISVGSPMSGVITRDPLGSVCGTEATGGHKGRNSELRMLTVVAARVGEVGG